MKNNNKSSQFYLWGLLLGILALGSCKKYDNPAAVYEDLKTVGSSQRKVLVISIDGLTGAELKTINPTNIASLEKNAKYSYNTLKTSSDAAGWVSMLTGTGFSKHQISNDNFERVQAGNDDHAPIVSYRNVFDYVTQYKSVKTAFITPWQNLRGYMRNADFLPVVSTDLAAKDSTLSILTNQAALGTIFVNFRDVISAGANGGYIASNANYKNAINKTDEYIGNIMTSLKARKNYANEDWLVIITSNHGGSSADPTNGFTIVYHPAFKPFELKKSGFNSVAFKSNAIGGVVANDKGLYDVGLTQDFTVQVQTLFANDTFYPGFLSKSSIINGTAQTGWMFFQQDGGRWGTSFGGTSNGATIGRTQAIGGVVVDGKWHTLTMTVKYVNATTRTVTTFTDGVQNNTANISNNRSLSTNEALRIGYRQFAGGSLNFNAANLQYFNVALDPAVIKNNIDLKDITKHPNYANLTGFWPMDEGAEGTFFNKAPVGYDMALEGPYTWANLGVLYPSGSISEPVTSSISIPSTVSDVSALTLYWMKINILPDFGFDGKAYLKNFELEFLK